MTSSVRDVATTLGDALMERIGEPRYHLWFADKTKFTRQGDTLVVGVPNHFYQEWLHKTYGDVVRSVAGAVYGEALQVHFAIDAKLVAEAKLPPAAPRPAGGLTRGQLQPQTNPDARRGTEVPHRSPPGGGGERSTAPARRWRPLHEFVVGACNRVAHASALSVVEEPAQGANPLLVHGPCGTGKTHLLEGIYVGLRRRQPSWRVCFVTAEDYTNRFVQSMRLGKLATFRKQFRDCDALLLDDLNFLATKKATQEEFLHTLDVLLMENRQIVVTCDCHPRIAEQFLPELTDRLMGGAVWSLTPPDLETRRQLLEHKALAIGLGSLPPDILALLTERLNGNVRELEGALHSLLHYQRVTQRSLDLQMAREALGDLLRHSVRVVQLGDIDRAVCAVLRLQNGSLQSQQRSWRNSHPRMLAMYLSRKHTAATYTEIGQYFGGRNHSTAVAAEKKVRQWLKDDDGPSLLDSSWRVADVVARVEREIQR